jgi:hypothetical protein
MSHRQEERFTAWVMVAAGVIVMGLCGLCTYEVSAAGGGNELVYIVGGVPILAGGFAVVMGCVSLARLQRKPPPKPDDRDG